MLKNLSLDFIITKKVKKGGEDFLEIIGYFQQLQLFEEILYVTFIMSIT